MIKEFELFAPCHFGLESVLKREITDLGYEITEVVDGRVSFKGDSSAIARCNVFLRTTERVMLKVGGFKAITFDELFEKKDEIALEVQKQVAEEMSTYGYIIVKTLITKVEPDAEVKQSMNEINAAQRKRVAAQELAEADKIKIVTAAEAEAEKDRLHGVGIAEQRKAIVDGLADSIKELKGANVELTEEQIMSILLTNQYLDTLNNFADKQGNNTIFLPANPDGVESIRTQILSALKAK